MNEIRRSHFPYCIQQVMPGWFVILNRDYKPLGLPSGEYVDYYDHMVRVRGFGAKKASQLSYKGDRDITFISLYGDGCIPTQSPEFEAAYFKRLSILYQLKFDDNAVKPAKCEIKQEANKSRKRKNRSKNASPLI